MAVHPLPNRPRAVADRQPVLRLAGKLSRMAGAALVGVRRVMLSVLGFGFLCAAAWMWSTIAGLATIGLSLLVLELLSSEDKNS
jgi:hypothetical protein